MPNRILRAPIRQSLRWNKLSYFDQTFYVRLITLVDDYGRYEAHPQLLANEAFPYGDPEGLPITCDAIAQSLQIICCAGMALVYEVEGKKYLQLTRWKEHARTDSKYPECPKEALHSKCTANAQQMITSPPTLSPSLSPTLSPSRASEQNEKAETLAVLNKVWGVLSASYKRPTETRRTYAEESELAEVCRRPDVERELQILMGYKKRLPSGERRFFPQSAGRLLEKWQATLDRARTYQPNSPNGVI